MRGLRLRIVEFRGGTRIKYAESNSVQLPINRANGHYEPEGVVCRTFATVRNNSHLRWCSVAQKRFAKLGPTFSLNATAHGPWISCGLYHLVRRDADRRVALSAPSRNSNCDSRTTQSGVLAGMLCEASLSSGLTFGDTAD